MSRIYILSGYFLVGVSIVGLFSFSASIFPNFRAYGFWLAVVIALILTALGLCDDYFAEVLGMSEYQYVGFLVSITLVLIVGGIIQWVR